MAQSNATTAIAVRHQIEQLVAQGRSAAEIDQVLVSEYGQTILLVPPDTGGIPLIWVIPLVLGAGALGARGGPLLAQKPGFRRAEGHRTRGRSSRGRPRRALGGPSPWRRGGARSVTAGRGAPERTPRGREDDRWHRRDERDFLRRSLDDADREHRAGDLSDEDHAVLVARDAVEAGRGRS